MKIGSLISQSGKNIPLKNKDGRYKLNKSTIDATPLFKKHEGRGSYF